VPAHRLVGWLTKLAIVSGTIVAGLGNTEDGHTDKYAQCVPLRKTSYYYFGVWCFFSTSSTTSVSSTALTLMLAVCATSIGPDS
jgi:hypothetical protein